MTNLLFVYGTLRNGVRNSRFHLYAADARLVGCARVPGRLWNVRRYPGFVPSADSGYSVFGEVYALDHLNEVLPRLDDYERCGRHDALPHEFERVTMDIVLESGAACEAWVYVYRGSVEKAEEILSGDYSKQPR